MMAFLASYVQCSKALRRHERRCRHPCLLQVRQCMPKVCLLTLQGDQHNLLQHCAYTWFALGCMAAGVPFTGLIDHNLKV